MDNSTYEIRLTITDSQPGRSRVKAATQIMQTIMDADTLAAMAGDGLIERLHAVGFALNHAPQVSEQVELSTGLATGMAGGAS